MGCRIALFVVLGTVVFAGCASTATTTGTSGSRPSSVRVTRATWRHGEWPFTVASGVLACVHPPTIGAVTFTTGGTVYAVNGTAMDAHYADISPIWRRTSGPTPRVDIGGMVDQGLKLC